MKRFLIIALSLIFPLFSCTSPSIVLEDTSKETPLPDNGIVTSSGNQSTGPGSISSVLPNPTPVKSLSNLPPINPVPTSISTVISPTPITSATSTPAINTTPSSVITPTGSSTPSPVVTPTSISTPDSSSTTVPASFSLTCTVPSAPSTSTINLMSNVAYSDVDPMNNLDISWPKQGTNHPLVILIHGGGFTTGDKLLFSNEIKILAGQGYAAASINYRLSTSTTNHFPIAVSDIRSALRYLRKTSAAFSIDPARVIALGNSAGGYLASMLGTTDDIPDFNNAGDDTGVSIKIQGVVSYYGIFDLRNKTGSDAVAFLGVSPTTDQAKASLASSILHVKSGDPPFLLLHGTIDSQVTVSEGNNMKSILNASSVNSKLVEMVGLDHGFSIFDPTLQSSCETLDFLKKTLNP